MYEQLLFLKRVLKNPRALGAVAPSSKFLARLISKNVICDPSSYVLEVGAGTGSLTRHLLASGLHEKRLIVVELDPELCKFLIKTFPTLCVLQGDARFLYDLLPSDVIGKISTVISGIPLINLKKSEQTELFYSFKDVLNENGSVLQFTYGMLSPFSHKEFGMTAKRLGFVFRNIPPAMVWEYKFKNQAFTTNLSKDLLIQTQRFYS